MAAPKVGWGSTPGETAVEAGKLKLLVRLSEAKDLAGAK
jgi:hypothetical protein